MEHQWLHQWLRTQREEAGLTQVSVAKQIGTTQPTLSALEAGRSRITVEILQQLAEVVGFDLSEAIQLPVKRDEQAA